jgi:hypothetical protein
VSDPEPEPSKPSKRQRPVKEVIEIPDYIPPKRKPSNQSNPIIID